MKFVPFRTHFFARISLRKLGLFYFRIYERSLKNFSFQDLGPKMAGDRAVMDEILRVLFDYQIFNQIDFRRKISEERFFSIFKVRNFLDQFT